MNIDETFKKYKISPGNTELIELGSKVLLANRTKEGWYLETLTNKLETNTQNKTDFSDMDYFHTGKSNSLIVAPALPPKPLVFKGMKLNVLPNQKLTFFIKIPLLFQVYFSKVVPENLLKEIDYKRLSDTWFGEPDGGEPAFSIGSEFSLDFNGVETEGFEAICPISVKNSTAQILDVQRLILRDENITLYKNGNRIVCSLVQIEYKGSDVISSADYLFSKEFNGEKQEILAKPRNSSGRHPLKINFHFIKNRYKNDNGI